MGKFVTQFSMSLDGFVAGPNDGNDNPLGDGGQALFKWYNSGDTEYRWPGGMRPARISQASAQYLKQTVTATGALVTARRTFEIAKAWGGRHPINLPVVVVTHHPDPIWANKPNSIFTFVTDGVENALHQAQAIAGEKDVSIGAPSLVSQALKLGMLDEIHIDLAPVILGGGVSLFGQLDRNQFELVSQDTVVGTDVTHLIFRVKK